MENKNIQENWEETILKSCIEAEKMYQLESDKTPESWFAIYNANVIQKIIRQFIKKEKEKTRQEIIAEIDKVYKKEGGIRNWLDLREKL